MSTSNVSNRLSLNPNNQSVNPNNQSVRLAKTNKITSHELLEKVGEVTERALTNSQKGESSINEGQKLIRIRSKSDKDFRGTLRHSGMATVNKGAKTLEMEEEKAEVVEEKGILKRTSTVSNFILSSDKVPAAKTILQEIGKYDLKNPEDQKRLGELTTSLVNLHNSFIVEKEKKHFFGKNTIETKVNKHEIEAFYAMLMDITKAALSVEGEDISDNPALHLICQVADLISGNENVMVLHTRIYEKYKKDPSTLNRLTVLATKQALTLPQQSTDLESFFRSETFGERLAVYRVKQDPDAHKFLKELKHTIETMVPKHTEEYVVDRRFEEKIKSADDNKKRFIQLTEQMADYVLTLNVPQIVCEMCAIRRDVVLKSENPAVKALSERGVGSLLSLRILGPSIVNLAQSKKPLGLKSAIIKDVFSAFQYFSTTFYLNYTPYVAEKPSTAATTFQVLNTEERHTAYCNFVARNTTVNSKEEV